MKKRLLAMISLALVAMLVLAACAPAGTGGPAGSEGGGAAGGGQAAGGGATASGSGDGGTVRDDITIAVISEWATLDPMVGNDMLAFAVMTQFFDGLVLINPDGEIEPGLATHWEISDDGTQYTFFLREGVLFHNGDVMTADDVVFSVERALASPATTRITGTIHGIEKIDDMTVMITLDHAYGPFLLCATQANLGIVSRRAVEEMGDEAFARHPIGTGPYVFVEWRPGDRLIMEAFQDYWRGPAAITHAEFRIITDAMATTVALESGDVDMALSVTASERENIVRNPNLAYYSTPSAAKWFIAFNMQEGIFADHPELRQAVAYSINRQDIIMGALEGLGYELTAPLTPEVFGYPENFVNNFPHNPERARQLVEEAGFLGHTIVLRTFESPNYAQPAAIMQEQLRLAGFDARLDLLERSAFMADVFTAGQYEIMFTALTALVPDADFHLFNRYHSQFMGGGVNITFTNVPEIDELLVRGRLSGDPAERMQIYYDLSNLIVNEHNIIVPLFVPMSSTAGHADLGGLQAHSAQRYFIYNLYWR